MGFGIVVVLWPYEWKVMGSNLGGQRISFIFAATYKSQNLGKGKGFGHCGGLL